MSTPQADTHGCRLARISRLAGLCIVLLMASALTDCNQSPPAGKAVPTTSAISVTTRPGEPIVIRTSTAEFQLTAAGYLQARLLRDGQELTLDDPQPEAGSSADYVVSGGKEIRDFVLELDHVRITDASGRLGASGRRIEVTGKSQSIPSLETTVAIEVYDSLPNLALASTSYKNTGTVEVPLDRIVTQQHILNASLSDQKARPYAMWSFHGSSEAWGKDDVMFITDKFSRANPMQLVMHNDENQTGGGIPVVAFWTGSVGEAIGHAEAVPLRLSLPVHTLADGRVNAAVVLDPDVLLAARAGVRNPVNVSSDFPRRFLRALKSLLEDAAVARGKPGTSHERRL